MTPESELPQTRYADADGVSVAYQVFGSGARDLVVVPGIISNIEQNWQLDSYAGFLRQLGRFFRVIQFDKRGQGLSDSIEGAPTLEERMDDVRAVMLAAQADRAVLFAMSEGGPMAALFTATYPSSVDRLVLYGSMARFTKAGDYPHRPTLERILQVAATTWGTRESAPLFAPSRAADAAYAEAVARYQRQTASPSAIRRLLVANDQIDVRAILPQVRRPTLIVHRRGDHVVSCANGRYLADHLPDAVYLELPGADHFADAGDAGAIVDALVRFAGEEATAASARPAERWLATVLFTDIVGSTELAGRLGDAGWRDLLRRFLAMSRAQLQAHRGHEIDTAGDGLFATFDGPARAIRCAAAMIAASADLGLPLRAGLHTGEVEPLAAKVSGMAVHIGARVMAEAGAGEVLVSGTVKDLVAGSGIAFELLGVYALKGVLGDWPLHRAQVAASA